MLRLVLLFLISITYVKSEVEYMEVDPKRLPVLLDKFVGCVEKTKADSNLMQVVMKWNFEDNDSVKKYMYCVAKDTGMGDSSGYLVKEKFLKLFETHKLKDKIGGVVDECNKLKGSNKYDTIFKVGNCFKNKSPVLFKL